MAVNDQRDPDQDGPQQAPPFESVEEGTFAEGVSGAHHTEHSAEQGTYADADVDPDPNEAKAHEDESDLPIVDDSSPPEPGLTENVRK